MKKLTPLGVLLSLTTIATAAPESFGPSAAATNDRRSYAPEGLGHGAVNPTSMASFAGKMMHGPADVLGGGTGKSETMLMVDAGDTGHAKTDTAAVRGLDTDAATGGVDTNTKQSS